MYDELVQFFKDFGPFFGIASVIGTIIYHAWNKRYCDGKDQEKEDGRIKLLESKTNQLDKALTALTTKTEQNSENIHILKESVLEQLGQIGKDVAKIQGTISGLKTD